MCGLTIISVILFGDSRTERLRDVTGHWQILIWKI